MRPANWFVDAEVDVSAPDPFAAPVQERGTRIDLREPTAALELRLAELIAREGRLFNAGITCAIKDRVDTCCSACPVCVAHLREERLSTLCRVGREQEAVCTELAVIRCRK